MAFFKTREYDHGHFEGDYSCGSHSSLPAKAKLADSNASITSPNSLPQLLHSQELREFTGYTQI